jgi:copper(I)-binding protein
MSMQGNVMKMQELKDGLAIPAHGDVKLAPGGYHIMLTQLKHPLVKGETAKLTLTFEHAGPVTLDFPIVGIGASGGGDMKGMDMKGMKGM